MTHAPTTSEDTPAPANTQSSITVLKSDLFGDIELVRSNKAPMICRQFGRASWWVKPLAYWTAKREAKALTRLVGLPGFAQLLDWQSGCLSRSFVEGEAMQDAKPRNPAYFKHAYRLLKQMHRLGVCHNDLAKEPNWLVTPDTRPALTDFQLATFGSRRSKWFRVLAREDIRHLLKHKRMYCPERLTDAEKRLLARPSHIRQLWFATGKPVYRFITRKVLRWEDNEGQGAAS